MIPNKLTDFELIEFLTHFGERISQQVIAQLSKFHLYFSGSCIPTNESLFILLALLTLAQTVHDIAQLLGDSR